MTPEWMDEIGGDLEWSGRDDYSYEPPVYAEMLPSAIGLAGGMAEPAQKAAVVTPATAPAPGPGGNALTNLLDKLPKWLLPVGAVVVGLSVMLAVSR